MKKLLLLLFLIPNLVMGESFYFVCDKVVVYDKYKKFENTRVTQAYKYNSLKKTLELEENQISKCIVRDEEISCFLIDQTDNIIITEINRVSLSLDEKICKKEKEEGCWLATEGKCKIVNEKQF